MTKDFCWTQLEKLEVHFGSVPPEAKNDYFEHLKFYSEEEMAKAVYTLVDSHRYRKFPLIRDIREVLDKVRFDAQSEPTAEEAAEYYDNAICAACGNTGFILKAVSPSEYKLGMSSATASFCTCRHGQKKRAAWEGYQEKKKLKQQTEHERRYEPVREEY